MFYDQIIAETLTFNLISYQLSFCIIVLSFYRFGIVTIKYQQKQLQTLVNCLVTITLFKTAFCRSQIQPGLIKVFN